MTNGYKAEKSYCIYTIVETHVAHFEKIYGLADTNRKFQKYDEAEKWIQEEGKRQINYTIIEIFRKS